MTSLSDDAYVGTLHYKFLDPPVLVGVDNLQDTCTIGNTTTTSIVMTGASASLDLQGTTAPNITFSNEDIRIIKGTSQKNISIGFDVGTANDNGTIEIGSDITNAGGECVNIGNGIATGAIAQGKFAVAIGKGAGQTAMSGSSVAIGTNAGSSNQGNGGTQSVAIGFTAGAENQGGVSVAIGAKAGSVDQKGESVALGSNAGAFRQGQASIAVGVGAGASRQGTNAIAIGYDCCPDTQGSDSIAIGSVGSGLPISSVVINGGGIVLTPATSGCFINPIAGGIANTLWWNSTTKEVQYHIP